MVNLITDEIDVLLLKLNVNNCADISQNLKIEIKGETNKRNVLPLLQKKHRWHRRRRLSNMPAEHERYIENCLIDVRDKFA